jgi:hypothetical protein
MLYSAQPGGSWGPVRMSPPSVIPHCIISGRPSTSAVSSTNPGGAAVPPTVTSPSRGSRTASWRTAARNPLRNEGVRIICSVPVSASSRATRRGSQRSTSSAAPPVINDSETDHSPSECISDWGVKRCSFVPSRSGSLGARPAYKLFRVCRIALGSPVVPEVNSTCATASGSVARATGTGWEPCWKNRTKSISPSATASPSTTRWCGTGSRGAISAAAAAHS